MNPKKKFPESPAEQVDQISLLGLSVDKTGRRHFAGSRIKIAYHLYQYTKKHAFVFPSIRRIAADLEIDPSTVCDFINHPDFAVFFEKIKRPWISNEYRIRAWVKSAFRSLEKLGFMIHFRDDFKRWRKLWQFRMPKFYLNRLLNKLTWDQVHEHKDYTNTFCTKGNDRSYTPPPHRSNTTRPPGIYEGILKTNIEHSTYPFANEFARSVELLETRFQLRGGDLYKISNYFSLNEIRKGIRIQEQRLKSGMVVKSPLYAFLGAINESRKRKRKPL